MYSLIQQYINFGHSFLIYFAIIYKCTDNIFWDAVGFNLPFDRILITLACQKVCLDSNSNICPPPPPLILHINYFVLCCVVDCTKVV